MNKREEKKVASMRRAIKCNLEGCGKHFIFSVSEDYVLSVEREKQRYKGTCSKCHASITLTIEGLHLFGKSFGEPKLNVNKTTFSDLFSCDE
jgi:hypothetical protein